jgi:hypothetical protein
MPAPARFAIAIAVVAVALAAIACSQRHGPRVSALNGRVVDWAGRPLADARVFVIWAAEINVLADSQRARIRICTTRSRSDGSYHVDAWQAPSIAQGAVRARSFAYLPGYNSRPAHRAVEHVGDSAAVYTLRTAEDGEVASWQEVKDLVVADCAAKVVTTGESDRPFPAPAPYVR